MPVIGAGYVNLCMLCSHARSEYFKNVVVVARRRDDEERTAVCAVCSATATCYCYLKDVGATLLALECELASRQAAEEA